MKDMRKLTNEELHRLSIDQYRQAEKIPVIIVLDNVRSLNNIGSVFRTADAFRIEKIYLCGITACPPHKDIHKTALGATESVTWAYEKDILQLLKELHQSQVETIAIEQVEGAQSLSDFLPEKGKKYALIFGNEVEGVQQEVVSLCGKAIEIPQYGTKHSLNISVSAGIVMWEIGQKIRKES
ncbi:SpoU family RNA methylase [Capnocytophaga sp. oral taxon 338 str. F0234]|nr:SpoU family RNA methylase [Capnocytophaga sp. oral taxon 338 str. F0234]